MLKEKEIQKILPIPHTTEVTCILGIIDEHLKDKYPTLYKWEDKNFQYLKIIEKEDANWLLQKARKLVGELGEIESALDGIGVDLFKNEKTEI